MFHIISSEWGIQNETVKHYGTDAIEKNIRFDMILTETRKSTGAHGSDLFITNMNKGEGYNE